MQRQTSSAIYPVENYTFGHKEPKLEKDRGTGDRLQRWKRAYEAEGMRRTVEGVCLTQRHNHAHVLLLQVGSTFFKLPGGKVRPGVDELETLKRKLSTHLSPSPTHIKWDIGECLGVFWRPNFETQMYPYLPPHVTRPKEIKKLYLICLPERAAFAVPQNLRLLAVPLFELYDNMARYGPMISSIPNLVSRLKLNVLGAELAPGTASGVAPAVPPGGAEQWEVSTKPEDDGDNIYTNN